MIHVTKRYSLTLLFLVVLLLAMLPLLAIYYTAHTVNTRMLRDEVTHSIMRQNEDFIARVQSDMTRIINTNYMLTQNWELGKLAAIPEDFTPYEMAQTFRNIQDKIFLAQLNSRFIKNINVYFPTLDKCLSTNSSNYKLSEMRQLTSDLDELPKDKFFIRDGEMMLVSENTFSSASEHTNMVVQTTLSQNELLAWLRDKSVNELSSGSIMSVQNMNWPRAVESDSIDAYFYNKVMDELTDTNIEQSGQMTLKYEDVTYQMIYSYMPYAGLVLMRYFDVSEIEGTFGTAQIMLILFAAVVALSFILIYYAIYRLVHRPLKALTAAFARVEQGNLNFELDEEARGEFAFVFKGFSHMLSSLRVLIDQTYLQGQMVKKSEFKQLQAQIDPHFLYNGFFILNKRIRAGDNTGALAFSKLLSDYFRYVTQNARDTVPLYEEVAHAYNYARIQQVRFSNRLELTLDPVPEKFEQLPIPRLVLQPIVENVFRHVLDGAQEMTKLRISYHETMSSVELWVEDSGSSITPEKLESMRRSLLSTQQDKEVSGLMNVHMRLQLFWGEDYGLSYDQSEMGGLLVRVCIPRGKEEI